MFVLFGGMLGCWVLQRYSEQRSTKVNIVDEKNIRFEISKPEKKNVSNYQTNSIKTVEVVDLTPKN